ncbi:MULTISPECIES: c-type cytochrome [Pseudomonas]|jgi:mono/diheme cytochrome c family protein|uniref:C-type cytochrome n=1 Tax=Pseudomonas capeferrum TaxID=1495066 RepID=A0ABY7RIP2_9PSED|nr:MULTISPECIES: c-type cytochrome [Pseudomonas]MUT50376.1 c-type cytochrome [Pseudomonas sp. TDA1]WCI02649.1 c-type cytochrome [Pseudomonas capeferrum]
MKTKTLLSAFCSLALVGLAGALYINNDTSADDIADNRITAAQASPADPAAIARGAYVSIQGDCVACHSVPSGKPFAGGYGLKTPFGVIYSTNITPDVKTGIGNWTERDFFRAVRHGKHKNGQFLYPAMPYNAYVRMSDNDLQDLWAYIRSLQPIEQTTPTNTLGFPYDIRLAMLGWNLLFFDNATLEVDPSRSEQWNRGRYLVDGAGHCASCHTPKNLLGADTGRYLQGADVAGIHAPEITGDPYRGIGAWSVEQLQQYLKTGTNHQAVASGTMGEVVEFSTQHLSNQDLAAIAHYLKSLPGSQATPPEVLAASTPVMRRGGEVYEHNCMACHNVAGEGIDGMVSGFADNSGIRASSHTNLISTVLIGSRAVITEHNPTGAGMPSFDWKLNDADIAAVLTYVRNSWGNAASEVKAQDVAGARERLGVQSPMQSGF